LFSSEGGLRAEGKRSPNSVPLKCAFVRGRAKSEGGGGVGGAQIRCPPPKKNSSQGGRTAERGRGGSRRSPNSVHHNFFSSEGGLTSGESHIGGGSHGGGGQADVGWGQALLFPMGAWPDKSPLDPPVCFTSFFHAHVRMRLRGKRDVHCPPRLRPVLSPSPLIDLAATPPPLPPIPVADLPATGRSSGYVDGSPLVSTTNRYRVLHGEDGCIEPRNSHSTQ
jgi:hypothetical protein